MALTFKGHFLFRYALFFSLFLAFQRGTAGQNYDRNGKYVGLKPKMAQLWNKDQEWGSTTRIGLKGFRKYQEQFRNKVKAFKQGDSQRSNIQRPQSSNQINSNGDQRYHQRQTTEQIKMQRLQQNAKQAKIQRLQQTTEQTKIQRPRYLKQVQTKIQRPR